MKKDNTNNGNGNGDSVGGGRLRRNNDLTKCCGIYFLNIKRNSNILSVIIVSHNVRTESVLSCSSANGSDASHLVNIYSLRWFCARDDAIVFSIHTAIHNVLTL